MTILNYEIIEKIYESLFSVIYKALQKNGKPVVIKALKKEYPSHEEIAILKREYDIIKSLFDVNGVIQVYKLENYKNSVIIVMEDFEALSLAIYMNKSPMQIKVFLPIAIEIVRIISEIQHKGVIHKDINPNNIILNPKTNQVKIIDFGISTNLSVESSEMQQLAGTLAYISPEQTGRMNRSVDYRTDLYSLGVTLYEMLVGQLPFKSDDPIEIVHCHIAKEAIPPYLLNNAIPKTVSDIIMKLMAKMAEDRYQSWFGLKKDLEKCLEQLESTGIINDFQIAQRDILERFQIPEKLYGREKDIEDLLATFDSISSGTTELVLVSGFSGVGKSSIVNELGKPIVQKRGYFISGKFDQFKRDIPLFSIKQAFQEMIRQILTEPSKKIDLWKEKLLNALGGNGQVIVNVIPELELIIGKQAPIQELGPIETHNRFNIVFQNFVRVFADSSHPLVIFLDDLQWADSASLSFIELLLNEMSKNYMMIIGAYRNNEVDKSHPLSITMRKIEQSGKKIHEIYVKPLALESIQQLLFETLYCQPEKVSELAQLVLQKTNGNPFFIKQFLTTLHKKNLITFNINSGSWEWDIELIQNAGITDNVVTLMIEKIQHLPENTQDILKQASCIGNMFDLNLLSSLNGKTFLENKDELWEALNENLILQINDPNKKFFYKFSHDRIHLASYSLLEEPNKKETHLKIGRIMLQSSSPDENIFQIVNHLNLSKELIVTPKEKEQLIYLNLQAGKKAKVSASHEVALKYVSIAMNLLNTNSWETEYDLTFSIYMERAELEHLNANYTKSEQYLNFAMEKAKTSIEKAEIYMLLNLLSVMAAKLFEAIEYAIKGLQLLGIEIPKDIETATVIEMEEIEKSLKNKDILSFMDLPEMTDPEKIMCMKLLSSLAPATFLGNVALFSFIVAKAINLSLKYGQSKEYAIYCYYGMSLLFVKSDYKRAYDFGMLSLKLSEKFNDKIQKAKTGLVLGNIIVSWIKPLSQCYEIQLETYKVAIEVGELICSSHSLNGILVHKNYQGENLENMLTEISNYLVFVKKINYSFVIEFLHAYSIIYWNLTERTKTENDFYDDTLDENQFLQSNIANNNLYFLCSYYKLRSYVDYIFGKYPQAYEWLKLAKKCDIDKMINQVECPFLETLILIMFYPEASEKDKLEYIEIIESNKKLFKGFSENCPENFLHIYLLISAELARISNDHLNALHLYDQAISAANKNGFTHIEALGNELAAKFWFKHDKNEFAYSYIKKAHHCYRLWGAKRKVTSLEREYFDIFSKPSINDKPTQHSSVNTSNTIVSFSLDIFSVVKAYQTISNVMDLENLLKTMIELVIENAGAEKGLFILETQGKFHIEAETSVSKKDVKVLHSIPLEQHDQLSEAIVLYVARTKKTVVLNDACNEGNFQNDPYVKRNKPKSILCIPLINQNKLIGILYLENNLITRAFTNERVKLLELLSAQMAISIENATIYKILEDLNLNLEHKVTERTEQLQQTNDKLYQEILERQRLERQKEDIERMMHHDLKTPLNGILSLCGRIQSGKNMNLDEYKLLERIKDNSKHILNMIENSLDIFKIEQGTYELHPEPCDMVNLFLKINDDLQVLRRAKNIDTIFNVDQKAMTDKIGYWIQGEYSLLMNMFGNLLKNAIEASPINQKITVSINTMENDHEVVIHNYGVIPEKIREHFFEKYSTSGKKGGTGLGTYSAFLITKAHSGKISFTTSESEGTKILIHLPKLNKALSYTKNVKISKPISSESIEAVSKAKLHILIADDNPNNRMIIEIMLDEYPYTFDMAENGEEVIKKVFINQYDLILMDMQMPLIDGLDATRAIRKHEETIGKTKPLPIIALTADTSEMMRQQCKEAGCTTFLSKPVEDQEDFIEAIARCF